MAGKGAIPFRENSRKALADTRLREAMKKAVGTFGGKRDAAISTLPDFEGLREKASELKLGVLERLEEYLKEFQENAEKRGTRVYRAADAAAAREIISGIFREKGVKRVVKSKSMVSEEIHLNEHLEKGGIEVVETDLGEYIVQLASESPSHIIAPAIHKDRTQVGKLFQEKLGVPFTDDISELTKIARQALREKFLGADAGVSGANFLVAQTGSIAIFTNEGNGRMVTTVPRLHLVITSMEKVIPALADLVPFIRLLPRSATGQVVTSYLSIVSGPRREGEGTGADEVHVVILDNGRSRILEGACREILKCIRCGACMNVCPVYRTVGGHAYGWTYPGPMGIVLTSALLGLEKSHPIVDASTLCGACAEVCPVKIPLVELILLLRREKVERGLVNFKEKSGMAAFGRAVGSRQLFSALQQYAHAFWPVIERFGGEAAKRVPRPARRTYLKEAREDEGG